MATEWITAIDKRPSDRNHKDVDVISHRLRRVDQLDRLPTSVLQQLAFCGYYEDLEKGVTLFRQGDLGSSWYAVLGGQLDVRLEQQSKDSKEKTPVTLCSLGVGATFGESILHDLPRESTVVTKSTCELLRVEQQDFKLIWEVVFFALLAIVSAAPAPGHLLAAAPVHVVAPVVSHTSYTLSHPAVVAHAPVVATVAHAPVVSVAHAPLVAHHPVW